MNQNYGTAGLLNGAMGGMVPQQYGGLLGGAFQQFRPEDQYGQMADPYAQWAAQQLQAVTPQMQMPQMALMAQPARTPRQDSRIEFGSMFNNN